MCLTQNYRWSVKNFLRVPSELIFLLRNATGRLSMPIFDIQALKPIKIRNILRYQGQIVCGCNGRDLAIGKGSGHLRGCEPGTFLGMPLGCPVVVWKDG